MNRYLHVLAEGQTEREFAQNVLGAYFAAKGIVVTSRCVMTSRKHHKKGGASTYAQIKNDLQKWMKEEQTRQPLFTTMFDLYALPKDFPNYASSLALANPYQRVESLEAAFARDINYPRFLPYIQLHEFEALLLANPEVLLYEYPEAQKAIEALKGIVAAHSGNPEKVNTGQTTAPSKRIIDLIPAYEGNKVMGATLVGLDDLRAARANCPHFALWLQQIEAWWDSLETG